MRPVWTMLLGAVLCTAAGCGGGYELVVPDVAAPAGGAGSATPRLRHDDFAGIYSPVNDAVLLVRVADGPVRAAYTNRQGYAAVAVAAPEKPGTYALSVFHKDVFGDEITATGRLYVFDPAVLVLVIDWEALDGAAGAVNRLAEAGVQIAYVRKDFAGDAGDSHDWLLARGLPDGPVLSWGWKRDWLARRTKVVGTLPMARQRLASMVLGVYREDDLQEAMERLNIVPLAFVDGKPDIWAWLPDQLLRATALRGSQDFTHLTPADVRQALQAAPPAGQKQE